MPQNFKQQTEAQLSRTPQQTPNAALAQLGQANRSGEHSQLKWQISPTLEVLTAIKSKLGIPATRCPLLSTEEVLTPAKLHRSNQGGGAGLSLNPKFPPLSPRRRVRAAAFKKCPKLAPHFLSIKGTTQKYVHSLTFLVIFCYSSLDAPETFLLFPMFTRFNHVPTVNLTPTHSSQNISSSICVSLPLSKPLIT